MKEKEITVLKVEPGICQKGSGLSGPGKTVPLRYGGTDCSHGIHLSG